MMVNINEAYRNNEYSESVPDPFQEYYIVMHLNEMYMMLSYSRDTTTVTKILIFRHWWNSNKRTESRDEVLKFLHYLNEDACYTPRQQIKFMRQIRDKIINELNQIHWGKFDFSSYQNKDAKALQQ